MHFDATNVKNSVSSTMPKYPAHPSLYAKARKPGERLFIGKADATTKGKFILDPVVGSTPPHMDFIAS